MTDHTTAPKGETIAEIVEWFIETPPLDVLEFMGEVGQPVSARTVAMLYMTENLCDLSCRHSNREEAPPTLEACAEILPPEQLAIFWEFLEKANAPADVQLEMERWQEKQRTEMKEWLESVANDEEALAAIRPIFEEVARERGLLPEAGNAEALQSWQASQTLKGENAEALQPEATEATG